MVYTPGLHTLYVHILAAVQDAVYSSEREAGPPSFFLSWSRTNSFFGFLSAQSH